jgi:predicted nucleotidyltransferase
MRTGEIEANLVKLNEVFGIEYIPELIERKINGKEKGVLPEVDLKFYRKEYERLVGELEKAQGNSNLPENPDGKAELNDLLIRLRIKYQQ